MTAQGTIRVVLIEDDPGDARMISGMLAADKSARFDVQRFETLSAGLRALKSRHVDVILLDLGLPDSDGLPTLSKTIAGAAGVPIIVVAAAEVTPAIQERVKVGGRMLLVKGDLTAAVLIDAVITQTGRGVALQDERLLRTVRVLVVEDNYGDLALIRLMLASDKTVRYEIVHGSKLVSGLELLERGADVMLLDLSLPDSEGLRTLQRVRAQNPTIPIIVLTGAEDREKAVEALANGAQDYLVKGKVDGYLLGRTILRRVNATSSASSDGGE